MKIGNTIKQLRKANGWTQNDLAAKLGVTQKVIHDYESGKTKPPTERLAEIARVLNISTDELLGVKIIHIKNKEEHLHRSSRLSKIQEEFAKLSQAEQTAIRKQILGLIAQRKNK